MSTRSLFERQLTPALRSIGFSVKIPDCTRSKKPFDYILGLICGVGLRFIAIEAKKADGWNLHISKFEEHQRRALSILSEMDRDSAWVAIGFLDLKNMKRGPDRKKLEAPATNQAFLIRWVDYLSIETKTGCSYIDLETNFMDCKLEWGKAGQYQSNSWVVPKTHKLFAKKFFLA